MIGEDPDSQISFDSLLERLRAGIDAEGLQGTVGSILDELRFRRKPGLFCNDAGVIFLRLTAPTDMGRCEREGEERVKGEHAPDEHGSDHEEEEDLFSSQSSPSFDSLFCGGGSTLLVCRFRIGGEGKPDSLRVGGTPSSIAVVVLCCFCSTFPIFETLLSTEQKIFCFEKRFRERTERYTKRSKRYKR